jgi:hypothetical protein
MERNVRVKKDRKIKFEGNGNDYWRRCCRVMKIDRVQNIEIRERMGTDIDIVETIEARRLKWYGHVQRMDDNCWSKRIFAWNRLNRRKSVRLSRTWRDDVNEAMEDRGLEDGDWHDRKRWRLGCEKQC